MSEAVIGVVVPAYHAGSFLDEAIESIRAQTLRTWECVIVDDGSTAETPRLLNTYRDPRIQSVRQKNVGGREARLRGFSLTKAPHIVFLDADDRLLPNALARYVNFLDHHLSVGVAMVNGLLSIRTANHSAGEVALFLINIPKVMSWNRSCADRLFPHHPKPVCVASRCPLLNGWEGKEGREIGCCWPGRLLPVNLLTWGNHLLWNIVFTRAVCSGVLPAIRRMRLASTKRRGPG